jgi:subtilase family serine protease
MVKSQSFLLTLGAGLAFFSAITISAQITPKQYLHGSVPEAVARFHLQPVGQLSLTNHLTLAIGLPLRNETELDNLLRQIYDPASPSFHQYLTLEQFTERFGPTEQDYEAVIDFANANSLKVTGTHPNRVALEVSGSVADIERVFHLTLNVYRHPSENRTFYAPDVEPSADLSVPILHVAGLEDYSLKRPMGVFKKLTATASGPIPNLGSGPGNTYMGYDFRAAYAPGVSLTGSGQSVALVEFDGYNSNDIAAYIQKAGLTNHVITISNVPVNGGIAIPGADNGEVCLDIEMVIAMAPGVSNIFVYEAPNGTAWSTMLSSITNTVNGTLPKQISSSWGGGSSDPVSEGIFKEMGVLGQSYFNASGDYDAYTGSIPYPSDSTNVTVVGGTVLTTTGPLGSFVSETVWNERTPNPNFGDWGSSGGISPTVQLPSWQQGINMTTNQGSTTMRNLPDVALTAANIFIIADTNQQETVGGTSCAAPLWAGFTALVNQQAAIGGKPSVGFINPAIYAIGKGANYNADFHDVTTGDNTWSGSPTLFYATNGYDLCTGWGSPAGQNLITALVGPLDVLVITPSSGFTSYGAIGGPFTVASQTFSLTNSSAASLNWRVASTSSWLNVSSSSGTLPVAGQTTVTIGLNSAASNLVAGTYVANVWFTNQTSGIVQDRQFTLQAVQPLVITPATGFTATGLAGGPFNVTTQNISLTNIGTTSLSWSLINTSLWLNASPTNGTLAPNGAVTTVAVSLNSTANNLAIGNYSASLWFSNQTTHVAQPLQFYLTVSPPELIQNGGFETGDFTSWTVNNNDGYNYVDNGTLTHNLISPHSGSWFAAFGQYSADGLCTISQTVPTVAGNSYLISFWWESVDFGFGTVPNEFQVVWNGITQLDQVNSGVFGWTNLRYLLTATSSSTTLLFGFADDNAFLVLDDVSVIPAQLPMLQTPVKTANSVNLNWSAVAGLNYQLQYKTNLVTQPNWINLGGVTNATGSIISLTDTNAIANSPQRFYRVQMSP